MKHYYTYRITNILLNKHYYGFRGTEIQPKMDLGIKYFSSSSDKEFIQDQKDNPHNYKYKILLVSSNRDPAISLEIKLHNKFNVAFNESFYNRSKQTSTRFTHGMANKRHSLETRLQMSLSAKGKNNHNYGIKHSKEYKENMSMICKAIPKTKEWNKNVSIGKTGTKKMNNGLLIKMVQPKDINEYLNNGWVYGSIKN